LVSPLRVRGFGITLLRVSCQKFEDAWFAIALNENNQFAACAFSDESQGRAKRAITDLFPKDKLSSESPLHLSQLEQVYKLYKGEGSVELDSLDFSNISDFRRKVYLILHQVPHGKVTTYGAIAKKLRMPQAARAVGTAVATNPFSLIVPCHRVLTSTLEILNYGMPGRKPSEGAYMKRRLLEREGVEFRDRKVSATSLWIPS
jgi:methylated-DNA-[protein]-cysteine S-methyltransferase